MALLQNVLAFLGMKRHRDTIKMQKGCACDKMEGGAYVSSKITVISGTSKPLQCYWEIQNNTLGKVPAQVQYIWSCNASGKEEQSNWFICSKQVEGRDITRAFPHADRFPKVLYQLSISKAITAVSLQSRTTAGAWHAAECASMTSNGNVIRQMELLPHSLVPSHQQRVWFHIAFAF